LAGGAPAEMAVSSGWQPLKTNAMTMNETNHK
jgi:hypothetical protein